MLLQTTLTDYWSERGKVCPCVINPSRAPQIYTDIQTHSLSPRTSFTFHRSLADWSTTAKRWLTLHHPPHVVFSWFLPLIYLPERVIMLTVHTFFSPSRHTRAQLSHDACCCVYSKNSRGESSRCFSVPENLCVIFQHNGELSLIFFIFFLYNNFRHLFSLWFCLFVFWGFFWCFVVLVRLFFYWFWFGLFS